MNYGYNTLNQVTGITGFGSTVSIPANGGYHTSGALRGLLHTFTFGNGQTTTLSYNNRRAMTRTSAGVLDLGFAYGDLRGNMTALTNNLDSTKNKTFTYDNLSRLDHFPGPWGSGNFDYNPNGNRSRKEVDGTVVGYYYHSNRLWFTSINNSHLNYGYNSDGDLTSFGDFTYDYTPFHRMYQAKQDNNILFISGFDGNGQRVYKTSNGKTTIYLRDFSGRLLSEIDSSDTFYTDYIYLNDRMVAREREPDPASDSDGDGLGYAEEISHGTDPYKPDTDEDGMDDGDGILDGVDPTPLGSTDTSWIISAVYLALLLE